MIGWVLTVLIALALVASASFKLIGGEAMAKGAASMGLSLDTVRIIGLIEIASVILFVIPRTGLLGTLLLAAYLGGAIATHVVHQQSPLSPIIIQCIVWITATIRFPELGTRLVGKLNAQ